MMLMQSKYKFVGRGLEYLCAALLILIVLIVFANVIGRYFFLAPLRWSDEVAQYMFLWLSYLGALAALMRGSHYSVPNLVEMLPGLPRLVVKTISDLVVVLILLVLVWFGWQLVNRLSFQTSLTLGVPVYYAYVALPLTAALMALVVCGQIVNRFRGVPPTSADVVRTGPLDVRPDDSVPNAPVAPSAMEKDKP
jgi:TRAP-type C4-dicarboxylate transport system permease small subunit